MEKHSSTWPSRANYGANGKVSLACFPGVLEGFALGAGLGIVLGLAMGLSSRLERALSLLTGLLRPIPTIGWIPLLILWLGIGEGSKVVVIAVGSFWPVLLNVISRASGEPTPVTWKWPGRWKRTDGLC